MCVLNGVIVVEPAIAGQVVAVLREGIVSLARLRLSEQDRAAKSIALFEYIRGQDFCNAIKRVQEKVGTLRDSLARERSLHDGWWRTREQQYAAILREASGVDARVRDLLGGRVLEPTDPGGMTIDALDPVSLIPSNSPKLKVQRAKNGAPRTGPILKIAKTVGLFNHIEKASVRTALFPEIPTGFQVVRENEQIKHARDSSVLLGYSVDANGNCRYTFRWSDREAAAQGGAAGRAKGKKDSAQHIEPTIYVEKFDPIGGEVINDRTSSVQRPGHWRAFMVTFPLRVPVQEIRAATVAYPTENCAYSPLMTDAERTTRDQDRQRRTAGSR